MTEEIHSPEAKVTRSVGVVAIDDGKILLVTEGEGSAHISGRKGLPAGRLEFGETERDAALREFSEETGLHAALEDFEEFPGNIFYASIDRKDGTTVNFKWTVFRVRNFTGELVPNNDVTPEWISLDQLDVLEEEGILLPNLINAVKAATISDK